MLNLNESFKALSLSAEPEILNSSKYNFNANQKGRSMIEMLGVLAIIGVLSVGGIAGYSKAMLKFKTNKTIDQIAMTVTNIRTLYAQQLNYDFDSTATKVPQQAYEMGIVDDAMISRKGGTGDDKDDIEKLVNPFGGNVYISSAKSGVQGTTTGAFILTFAGLPREACVNIATNDWGSNYSSGLLGIGTGVSATAAQDLACGVANAVTDTGAIGTTGSAVASGGFVCATDNRPLRVDEAADGCNCDNANTCFVTFKYY